MDFIRFSISKPVTVTVGIILVVMFGFLWVFNRTLNVVSLAVSTLFTLFVAPALLAFFIGFEKSRA